MLPAAHPLADRPAVALADLAGEHWLARTHREPYEHAYETMCRIAGFEPDIAFHVDDYGAMQGLVAAGLGVSLAPALSLAPLREDVVVRPVTQPLFTRHVSVLTLVDTAQAAPLADFIEILRRTAAALPDASPAPPGHQR